MSRKDEQLISISGLTVSELADLLGKSRQAIYAGINNLKKDYFSPAELSAILLELRRINDVHLEQLEQFIQAEYRDAHTILPGLSYIERLKTLFAEANGIIFFLPTVRSNVIQRSPPYLVDLLNTALSGKRSLIFFVPDSISGDLLNIVLADGIKFVTSSGGSVQIIASELANKFVSLVVVGNSHEVRVFALGNTLAEEVIPIEAERIKAFIPNHYIQKCFDPYIEHIDHQEKLVG